MTKIKFYIFLAFSCSCVSLLAQKNDTISASEQVLINNLQKHIKTLAADSMGGRESGSDGAFMAAEYISGCFSKAGLLKPDNDSYYIPFATTKLYGINIIGIIEGTDLKEQVVIVSAHYDHVGIYGGNVYNGADDNASGVAAMIEIAQIFANMAKNNERPRRTVVFIAFDAKEKEMNGSGYYVQRPLYSLSNTIVNLNIDAVGRIEGSPNGRPDYMFLVGTDRISSDLNAISDRVNSQHDINLYLDYSFYGSEIFSEIFYTFSDQYHFGKNQIPIIYYTGGLHDDLYKPTDKEEFINYEILKKRTQLIFYTAWELATCNERPKKDLQKKNNCK